jgi:hypothetical protein
MGERRYRKAPGHARAGRDGDPALQGGGDRRRRCNEGDTFTAFSDESHGALIVLPQAPPEERVSEQHLIAVERTLEGKGVASPARCYEVLTRRASERPKVIITARRSTPGKGRQTFKRSSNSTSRRALRGRNGKKRKKE